MGQRLTAAKDRTKRAVRAAVRYTTDGCTFAPNFNFRECCVQHDWDYAHYHRESEAKRAELDKKMRLCIKCRGHVVCAWTYWAFVRAFGWIPYWIKARRERLTVEEDRNGRS